MATPILSVLQPNASPWTQSYGYDVIARLTNVMSTAGGFGSAHLSDISDRVHTLNLPGAAGNKYISNDYDGLARMTGTELDTSFSSPANRHSYEYNQAHQRTKQTYTGNNYIDCKSVQKVSCHRLPIMTVSS